MEDTAPPGPRFDLDGRPWENDPMLSALCALVACNVHAHARIMNDWAPLDTREGRAIMDRKMLAVGEMTGARQALALYLGLHPDRDADKEDAPDTLAMRWWMAHYPEMDDVPGWDELQALARSHPPL